MKPGLTLQIVALMGALALTACGRFQGEADPLSTGPGSVSLGSSGQELSDAQIQDSIAELVDVFQAFSGQTDSLDLPAGYLGTHQEALKKLLGGESINLGELASLLLLGEDVQPELSGAIGPGPHPVVTFRWIGAGESLSKSELLSRLEEELLAASAPSLKSVADALMAFDSKTFGGNADGRLTRDEADVQGLVLGAVERLSEGELRLSLPPTSPEDRLLLRQLKAKFNKQIAFGHPAPSFEALTLADLRAEWMRLALELYAARKRAGAGIPLEGFGAAKKSVAFYDGRMGGGNADGRLQALELYNLDSDTRFADGLLKGLGLANQSYAAAAGALRAHPALLSRVFRIFPEAAPCLFVARKDCRDVSVKDLTMRESYFRTLEAYDTARRGGNGDRKLDGAELRTLLAYVTVLDGLYFEYDADHDSRMSKPEARVILKALGIQDPRAVDAFFADAGLESGKANFWEGFEILLSGLLGSSHLRPHEFHRRLEKVLPAYI